MDPDMEQLLGNSWGNPKSPCGILSVGNHKIHIMLLNQRQQLLANHPASHLTHNIPY
jgi:hypothetical protein